MKYSASPLSVGPTGEKTRVWAALGSTFLLEARRLGPGSGLAPNLLSFKRISVAASVKSREHDPCYVSHEVVVTLPLEKKWENIFVLIKARMQLLCPTVPPLLFHSQKCPPQTLRTFSFHRALRLARGLSHRVTFGLPLDSKLSFAFMNHKHWD